MLYFGIIKSAFFISLNPNLTVKATGISSLLTADITFRTFDNVGLGYYTLEPPYCGHYIPDIRQRLVLGIIPQNPGSLVVIPQSILFGIISHISPDISHFN